MKRLRPRDAAQLLVDKVPTRFTKSELGLPPDCNREDILRSLQSHPVLEAADGHPGTLVRGRVGSGLIGSDRTGSDPPNLWSGRSVAVWRGGGGEGLRRGGCRVFRGEEGLVLTT